MTLYQRRHNLADHYKYLRARGALTLQSAPVKVLGVSLSALPDPGDYPGCSCYACDAPTWPSPRQTRRSRCPQCRSTTCLGSADHTYGCTANRRLVSA